MSCRIARGPPLRAQKNPGGTLSGGRGGSGCVTQCDEGPRIGDNVVYGERGVFRLERLPWSIVEGSDPSPNRREGLAVRRSVFDGRAGRKAVETDARFRLRDSHTRLGCRLIGDDARGDDGD